VRRERAISYQESLEYKARLSSLEQQSLNASMNRHFIFNSLNSIQYFINTQDKISANRYLTNFAKLIRKNLDSSSEDNNMVSLSQEIERLELYISLESMRFRDRFEYKIEVPDIDTENIMVPAMLFQPFVENSIIHGILPDTSKKGLITIKIEAKVDYLEVILEDNGIGIDYSLNKKRQSEGDHRSQGMEITSKRIELLKKLSHRNFEMEGPFQIEDENHSINGTRVLLKIPCENLD
jgi:sensor histidine kinase YesM